MFHYPNFESSWQSYPTHHTPNLGSVYNSFGRKATIKELGETVSDLPFIISFQYIHPRDTANGQWWKLSSAPKGKSHLFPDHFHETGSNLIWMLSFIILMQYHTYWQALLVWERLGQVLRLWPALPQTKQRASVFSQVWFWRAQQLQLLQWNQAAK